MEGPEGYAKYKETTDEVLKISATLDDTKKVKFFIYPHLKNDKMNQSFHIVLYLSLTYDSIQMAAEFFDDKLLSIGYATFGVFETRNLTLDDFVFLEALTNIGMNLLHK